MNRRNASPESLPGYLGRTSGEEETAAPASQQGSPSAEAESQRGAGESTQTKSDGPAAGSGVSEDLTLYDQIVMVPFRIRELRKSTSATAGPPPLDRWVDFLTSARATKPLWTEQEPFFPFDSTGSHPKHRAYDRIRYAEYAYFHPFVRAFLYPTGEDRFHAEHEQRRRPTSTGQTANQEASGVTDFSNRSLRVLEHARDIRWAAVFVRNMKDEDTGNDSMGKPCIDIFLLRVRRVEAYLFETRIGFVVVEFDTRKTAGRESPKLLAESYDGRANENMFDVHLGDEREWFPESPDNAVLELAESFRCLEKDSHQQFKYCFVESPNLDQVLLLQNMLRRGYPPYWIHDPMLERIPHGGDCSGGKTVEAVVWLDRNGQPVFDASAWDDDRLDLNAALTSAPSQLFWSLNWQKRVADTRATGVPALFPWWRELLSPMEQLDGRSDTGMSTEAIWLHQALSYGERKWTAAEADKLGRVYYSMFGDDRFPCMAYLAVKDPRDLELSQWMRLAFADGPGKQADDMPYSRWLWEIDREAEGDVAVEETCVGQQFRQKFCYDRFFFRKSTGGDTPPHTVPELESTRYLCSGEVFVAAGSSLGEPQVVKLSDSQQYSLKPFALDPISGLLAHFRYHYFKLGLIAHFHRCSLLNFEDELSIAVSENLGKDPDTTHDDENFRSMVLRIRRELIKFRFRFWFTEVSGQTQARELFAPLVGPPGNAEAV